MRFRILHYISLFLLTACSMVVLSSCDFDYDSNSCSFYGNSLYVHVTHVERCGNDVFIDYSMSDMAKVLLTYNLTFIRFYDETGREYTNVTKNDGFYLMPSYGIEDRIIIHDYTYPHGEPHSISVEAQDGQKTTAFVCRNYLVKDQVPSTKNSFETCDPCLKVSSYKVKRRSDGKCLFEFSPYSLEHRRVGAMIESFEATDENGRHYEFTPMVDFTQSGYSMKEINNFSADDFDYHNYTKILEGIDPAAKELSISMRLRYTVLGVVEPPYGMIHFHRLPIK